MDGSNTNQQQQQQDGGGTTTGDNMSQASSHSRSKLSGSLLDRIRAKQQAGENGSVSGQGQMIVEPAATPSHISIPNYNPTATTSTSNYYNTNQNTNASTTHHNLNVSHDMSELGSSSLLTSSGMLENFIGGGEGGVGGGLGQSLLGSDHQVGDPNYSMQNYFQTFVMDVYNLFISMPLLAQIIVLVTMLFLVYKLI